MIDPISFDFRTGTAQTRLQAAGVPHSISPLRSAPYVAAAPIARRQPMGTVRWTRVRRTRGLTVKGDDTWGAGLENCLEP